MVYGNAPSRLPGGVGGGLPGRLAPSVSGRGRGGGGPSQGGWPDPSGVRLRGRGPPSHGAWRRPSQGEGTPLPYYPPVFMSWQYSYRRL